jgi:hypothetical protein
MTKKIIIYNSFARDGHTTLLQRQLVEVNKELLTRRTIDKKALLNEKRLLQRQLRANDLKIGWDEVTKPTPAEEQAYGEGYHSQLRSSPYSESNLTKFWERGREAAKLKNKFRKNSYVVGVRGQSFQPPKQRDDGSRDFRSERGYVAKIINTAKGSVLARSEPFISEASAKRWAAEQAPKYRTMRTKAEVEMVFYDPERVNDIGSPKGKFRVGQTVSFAGSGPTRGQRFSATVREIDYDDNGDIIYTVIDPSSGRKIAFNEYELH